MGESVMKFKLKLRHGGDVTYGRAMRLDILTVKIRLSHPKKLARYHPVIIASEVMRPHASATFDVGSASSDKPSIHSPFWGHGPKPLGHLSAGG